MSHLQPIVYLLFLGLFVPGTLLVCWCWSYHLAKLLADGFLTFGYNRLGQFLGVAAILVADVVVFGSEYLSSGTSGALAPFSLVSVGVAVVVTVLGVGVLVAFFAVVRIVGWRLLHGRPPAEEANGA